MDAFPQLILVAGGLGTRMGREEPKALISVGGTPLFVRTLNAFLDAALLDHAIVVYPEGHKVAFRAALDAAFPQNSVQLIAGGAERFDSVRNGLAALDPRCSLVLIHDAARPFIPAATIGEVMEVAFTSGAATVATPVKDTILKVSPEHLLEATPDRSRLWACQTPQVFQRDVIDDAYAVALPSMPTDDASLVRHNGHEVQIVPGPDTNIKITTPNDLNYADFLLEKGLV